MTGSLDGTGTRAGHGLGWIYAQDQADDDTLFSGPAVIEDQFEFLFFDGPAPLFHIMFLGEYESFPFVQTASHVEPLEGPEEHLAVPRFPAESERLSQQYTADATPVKAGVNNEPAKSRAIRLGQASVYGHGPRQLAFGYGRPEAVTERVKGIEEFGELSPDLCLECDVEIPVVMVVHRMELG